MSADKGRSYKYDLAISFAGEQRDLARTIAERLDAAGYSIFFDEFHQAELWGRDLTVALGDVYSREARWCLVVVSEAYVQKAWTNLERQNALARFMSQRAGYLLCLRVDNTHLPGLPGVIAYLDLARTDPESLYSSLLEKLGSPSHEDFVPQLNTADREFARSIIEACYRRAVFTRMNSEIDLQSMYRSIGEAIGKIQSIIPRIVSQRLQHTGIRIVQALDEIERVRNRSSARMSDRLEPELARHIDDHKRQIIRLLLEIRRAGAISIQLPLSLRTDHFFELESAREPPSPGEW